MLNRLLFFSLITFITCSTSAQDLDLIVTSTGDSIACKIDSITDDLIYFEAERNGRSLKTQIDKSLVSDYEMIAVDLFMISPIPNSIFFESKKNPTGYIGQYRILRKKFDYQDYTGDTDAPYYPAISAVTSIVIPGLGQAIAGEPLRGLAFLTMDLASWLAMPVGFALAWGASTDAGETFAIGLMFAGAAGVFAFPTWAAIDAVRVTKVKSVAWQASAKTASLKLTPNLLQLPNADFAPGLTLSFRF